jgi:hypothetical protein
LHLDKRFRPPRNEDRVASVANLIGKKGGEDMEAIGRKRWAIPEGYIPSESSFSDRALVSHETACILNAGDDDAHVTSRFFSLIASRSVPTA